MPHLLNLFELYILLLVNSYPIVLSVLSEILRLEFFNSFVMKFVALPTYVNSAINIRITKYIVVFDGN
jgi:hypothetical protein